MARKVNTGRTTNQERIENLEAYVAFLCEILTDCGRALDLRQGFGWVEILPGIKRLQGKELSEAEKSRLETQAVQAQELSITAFPDVPSGDRELDDAS